MNKGMVFINVILDILIQYTAYKWARDQRERWLLGVIMMVAACLTVISLSSSVLISLGLLILSLVLFAISCIKEMK